VGEYGSSEWDTLSSQNDVPLIQAALERYGFPPESIHVLSDAAATKTGIEDAIEEYLGSAKEGDVVFLHYSGHGQRISDDNGDELDGYDETWVPYDAPKRGEDYHGENHLRDDELNVILQRLRRAVGPNGNVILTIDSCFSGGTSRGTARVRGGPPLGSPQPRESQPADNDAGGGFFEEPLRTRSVTDQPTGLAPYVVFSAARHDQLDYETADDQGRVVGPLSFAFAKTLAGSEVISTYRDLFEKLEWVMQARVPNRPQVEGNIDAELFSGEAVLQLPFVNVASVLSGGERVVLDAGSLQGVLKGSRVELHRAGTPQPTSETLMSRAVVSEVKYTEAVADLETATPRGELERARAFITEYAFGALRVRVALDSSLQRLLKDTLESVSAVELVDSESDLAVRATSDGNVVVDITATGHRIYGPEPVDKPNLTHELGSRLVDFARSQYLRGIRFEDSAFRVVLEIVPLDATRCRDPRNPSTCLELDISAKQVQGKESIWKIGDYFKLRARNESERAAYITILDLPSDGTINALWPPGDTTERKKLEAGENWSPAVVYQFAEPPGNDVILLIASEERIDFRPFLTRSMPLQRSAGAPSLLGPFAPLFDDDAVRTRSTVSYEAGSVATHAVTITVEP